jgi:hypothetical protein
MFHGLLLSGECACRENSNVQRSCGKAMPVGGSQ